MRKHTITSYEGGYTPANITNGLVGLQIGANPLLNGKCLVNGYFAMHEYEGVESYDFAPYPLAGDIYLGNVTMSQRPDLVRFRRQSYDFACGEFTTEMDFVVNGVTASIEVLTFASRSMPTVVLQEIRVRVDKDCPLVITGRIDPTGVPGRCLAREVPNMGWRIADGLLHWESRGAVTTVGAAYLTEFSGETVAPRRDFWGHTNAPSTDYAFGAHPSRTYVLRQYTSVVPSSSHTYPHQQAVHLVRIALHSGFDELRQRNREAWAEIWKGRIRLIGAEDRWQDITDSAYFYLHTSIHASNPCSVAPFGLGHRHYGGGVLWDTDTFMYPTVLLTAPKAARNLMDFRSRSLPQARRNAQMNGYDGLLFANGGRNGEDYCAYWASAVFHEQHMNLETAFAVLQYAYATGDAAFERNQAWPMIEGVAQWVASRVVKTARGYEIRRITGIDEDVENVNNNAHTNLMAARILREAIAMATRLGITPDRQWAKVATGMYLPIDTTTGGLLKHDGYVYDPKIFYNPETLMSFFPFGCHPGEAIEQATLKTDLKRAISYLGNPMMSPMFAVLAARQGDRAFAGELVEGGVAGYTTAPFLQFVEYADRSGAKDKKPAMTPYLATLGAHLVSVLYGNTGLELSSGDPQSWLRYKPAMPSPWEGVEAEIQFRQQRGLLTAKQGDERAQIKVLPDEE